MLQCHKTTVRPVEAKIEAVVTRMNTVSLQFPDEVQSVCALSLLRVKQEGYCGTERDHNVRPLVVPVEVAFPP